MLAGTDDSLIISLFNKILFNLFIYMEQEQKKLTHRQKIWADMYVRSCDAGGSYMKVFSQTNKKNCDVSAYKLMNNPQYAHVQQYVKEERIKVADKYNYSKEKLIRELLDIKDKFREMIALASLTNIKKADEDKLKRLSMILKGTNMTQNNDMLAKLLGAYEAEKIDINNKVFNVTFGSDDETESLGNTNNIDKDPWDE
jgi:hypothetical protein